MVKHIFYFYVDGECIDYTIEYEKLSSDEFPTTIKICRSVFELKSTNFVVRENQLHIYGHYHVKIDPKLALESKIILLQNTVV